MANAVIGALRAVLGMDSAAFTDGANAAQKRMNSFKRSMQKTGKSLSRVGAGMTAGLTTPLIGLAYKSVAAQKEQERAIASVSTALESMGDGAGYTLKQLEGMASKLQDGSLYGDEAILSRVTANLLTFGNIQGDVFARAQQSAIDLSARLGQDLQSSAVMLGKALNDPIKGLSALSRVGVSFTEQQKEQIKAMAKAGDVAGAQALMLAELEKQYAGQARALAETDSGKVTQAMNAIGDATERIGAIILPIMADIAGYVKDLAERFQGLSPEIQKFIVVGGGLVAAIGPVVAGLGLMMLALAPMAGVVMAIVSPLGLLAGAVAAAGVAVYQNWASLKEDFPAITGAIESAISGLRAAFDNVVEAAGIFGAGLKERLGLLASGVEALINGEFSKAWSALSAMFQNSLQTILATLDALFGSVDERIIAAVSSFGANVLAALGQLLSDVSQAAINIGYEIVAGIKRGLQEKWQDLKGYVSGLGTGMAQKFKDVLGIRSPSKVFQNFGAFIVQGLVQGIEGGLGSVQGAMGSMTGLLNMGGLTGEASATEGALKDIGSTAGSVFGEMGRLIGEGVRGARSLKDALGGVLQSLGNVLLKQAQASITGMFGGSGSIGGAIAGSIFSGLAGFADGGSFNVGGAGGIDSQVVAFRASPNESVHITKPGQGIGGQASINFAPVIDARGADAGAVARLESALQRANAEFSSNVVKTVRDAQKKRHL